MEGAGSRDRRAAGRLARARTHGGLGEDRRQAFERLRPVAGLDRAGDVVERQHGVGLAAAEVGLEPDHRLAGLAVEPPDGDAE